MPDSYGVCLTGVGRGRRVRCGEPEDQHRVHRDEAEQQQDWEVRLAPWSPNFVKSFTKSQRRKLPRVQRSVNGTCVGCATDCVA